MTIENIDINLSQILIAVFTLHQKAHLFIYFFYCSLFNLHTYHDFISKPK